MLFMACSGDAANSIKLLNSGITRENMGNKDMAYAEYHRAAKVYPKNHRAYYQMALIDLYDKAQPDKAYENLVQAEALAPDDRDVLFQLGRYYLRLSDPDYTQALKYFNRALELDPNYAPALYSKGYIYLQTDQAQEANQFLRRAIETDPRYAPAWRDLGELYESYRHYDDALAVYKRGLEYADETGELLNAAGNLEVRRERPEEAIVYFERAIQGTPDRSDFLFNLALAFVSTGDAKNAFRYISQYLNLVPQSETENIQVALMVRNQMRHILEKEKQDAN